MIKLYVLVAIMEVFDRLLCSFGQDALDSLYWNSRLRPTGRRIVFSTIIVMVYICFHSIVLYLHVATLNVALNSNDQSLLTLLVSGNFAEIKSSVFKKFDKQNLFQLTCSDIIERFKLLLFLLLILLLNLCQDGSGSAFYGFLKVGGIVLFGEMFSDWVKHSFITKFNHVKSTVYSDYMLILCGDLVGGEKHESTHAINKRLGMAQIPFACVVVRMVSEANKYSTYYFSSNATIVAVAFFTFAFLLFVKIILGLALKSIANSILNSPIVFDELGDILGNMHSKHPTAPATKSSATMSDPGGRVKFSSRSGLKFGQPGDMKRSPNSPTQRMRLQRQSMVDLESMERFSMKDEIR